GVPVQCRSVDSIIKKNGCTYIKYDVEGADKQALLGSIKTIRNFNPKICTALYHRAYDILDLPLMINAIKSNYKMYLRQYPYYPCWETNLFCTK
ncbi:MAG: FkbM family methyltransferase, partial [Ruminococcus sp.]|nr:FkbM family methyltransferase [Ruminococcus sp.]